MRCYRSKGAEDAESVALGDTMVESDAGVSASLLWPLHAATESASMVQAMVWRNVVVFMFVVRLDCSFGGKLMMVVLSSSATCGCSEAEETLEVALTCCWILMVRLFQFFGNPIEWHVMGQEVGQGAIEMVVSCIDVHVECHFAIVFCIFGIEEEGAGKQTVEAVPACVFDGVWPNANDSAVVFAKQPAMQSVQHDLWGAILAVDLTTYPVGVIIRTDIDHIAEPLPIQAMAIAISDDQDGFFFGGLPEQGADASLIPFVLHDMNIGPVFVDSCCQCR